MKIQAFPRNLSLLASAFALIAFAPGCSVEVVDDDDSAGDGDTAGDDNGDDADDTTSGEDEVGTDDDTTDDGTTDDGTTDDGTTDDGTTDDGTTDDGTTEGETGTEDCAIPDPGWGGQAAVGAPAPHFGGVNQYGEDVNICEYAGIPTLIDTSAVWCGPCQMMSLCLGGQDNLCVELFGGNQGVMDVLINPLRAEIEADTFAWVTVITEDEGGSPPNNADAIAWDQNYPGPEKVWVVSDDAQNYYTHLPLMQFPSFWLIDEDMNWQDLDQMNVFNTVIQQHL